MKTRCSRWCEVLAAALAALFLAAGVSAAAGDFSLVDQGWRILEQDGKRVVEMRVLLTNNSSAPSSYEVRFRVERQTKPAPNAAERTSTPAAGEPQPEWEVVSRVSVKGGPLAPGKAEVVKAVFPHEVLQPGKACRFFAGLVEPDTGAVLATTSITAAKIAATGIAAISGAQVVAAVGAAAAIAGGLGGGGEEQPATIGGSGTMVGEHESHRVSDEWVEHGSGDIDVTSSAGHLVLTYTYDASGPDATSLTASATATGTFTPAGAGDPEAVTITSATAQITQAGDRQEAGGVITRTGSVATGTFSGTIGARPWSGVLTMTEGVMTLNLASDTGSHQFTIQFTAS
jgi:hypothetical protein